MRLVFVLENIRSGGNVGSILRTADGLGVAEIVLAGYTPAPPHRAILKTSLGAEESVAWRHVADDLPAALDGFRQNGYHIAALEQAPESVALRDFAKCNSNDLVLILGNEVRGVSENVLALCDSIVEIPQHGTKKSLNVSVAAGIAAWSLLRRA